MMVMMRSQNEPYTAEDLQQKWYNIIEWTAQELKFYEEQQLVTTARKMGYRLTELAILARKDNPNITADELLQLGASIYAGYG
jgi:hypothetical protein